MGRMSFLGAGGAVAFDLQVSPGDLPRQRLYVRHRARARARQSQVEGIDAQGLHQVENLDLLFDGRIADGRRLQAVAQGFVVEQDRSARRQLRRRYLVPVVDQVRTVHQE